MDMAHSGCRGMIKKILVCNRGEIARRIIRACREMGIYSISIYSDVDKASPHVTEADEAVLVGRSNPKESYLNMERIIEIAKERGVDAIHPGYGFLSENPQFAKMCEDEGLIFIGPPSSVIKDLGDKVYARTLMKKNGIPIVPGTIEALEDEEDLIKAANELQFPILIKAAAGGGGKGMRIVERKDELPFAIREAKEEAKKAFGDGRLYLERFLKRPRHIEFQILRDQFGNSIHLFERECSIQRRYQKLVEESPSPFLDHQLREEMANTALRVADISGYVNAGTVEFLVDSEKNYYFLEVNTRVQVEHPVTELLTGVDIIKSQLEIASGIPLRYGQKDIIPKGHAIECRIYAEDPERGFAPSPGKILLYKEPSGPGVRVDSGVRQGMDIPLEYDPILSKLIVWAGDRQSACIRMIQALKEYVILGIKTNIQFLIELIQNERFMKGKLHTSFISDMEISKKDDAELRQLAMISYILVKGMRYQGVEKEEIRSQTLSPWNRLGRWRL